MKLLKRGQVSGIQTFIIGIVGVAVVLAVGLIVLSELQGSTVDTSCNTSNGAGCSAAYNSTGTIITKLAGVPTWIGIDNQAVTITA